MEGFQSFPAPAKVNLFLHIVGQREDGYHLLQTVFRLIDLHDTVYLKVQEDGIISRTSEIPNVSEAQDLCLRAARLLKAYTGSRLGVDISLVKRIPIGGGLGGGSSDAATVLLALNRLWALNLPRQTLMDIGVQLGADVPFFIFGKNAWAEGIGEKMQAISLDPAWYVVTTPHIHVSTAQIFSAKELTRNTIPTTIAAFSKVMVRNDLEPVVCQQYPAIASCLEWLSQFTRSRMSGSGASVFVEVENQAIAENIHKQVPEKIAETAIFSCVAQGLEVHPLYNYAE
ncbi:MAG: 4-(cytidine 5'-diphospho)-2-C-methyl-D-erythritol kinase [Methylophilaceae bacterium]